MTPEVRNYRTAVEDMRHAGMTHSLSTVELGRLFWIGFALDQIHRILDDLLKVAEGISPLPRRFIAGR